MSLESPPPGSPGTARRRSFSHRAIWLLVAGLTLGVIALSLFRPQITEFIELKLLDLKFLYRVRSRRAKTWRLWPLTTTV